MDPHNLPTQVKAFGLIRVVYKLHEDTPENTRSKVITKVRKFFQKIRESMPMPEFLELVVPVINEFNLPCLDEDPI